MKKKKENKPEKSKKKLKIFVIILIIFVLSGILLQIHSSYRRAKLVSSLAPGETNTEETDVTSEEDTPEIVISYKDENEMNNEYADYLTQHPIDFSSGEVKITLTSYYDSPIIIFQNNGDNSNYYSVSIGEDSYEEYISGTKSYHHATSAGNDLWSISEIKDSDDDFQNLFTSTIDSIDMENVFALIDEMPKIRYQRTLTIGGIEELEEFAILLNEENSGTTPDMTDEEYEEYVEELENEAKVMQEKLESDPESIYDVDNTEVGYIYLYIDSDTGEIKYINASYGENSKAQIVFTSNPDEKNLPVNAEYANDNASTEQVLYDLLDKCVSS